MIPPVTSMWRDVNVFNGAGIPSITYGPDSGEGTSYFEAEDLVHACQAYALTAIFACG